MFATAFVVFPRANTYSQYVALLAGGPLVPLRSQGQNKTTRSNRAGGGMSEARGEAISGLYGLTRWLVGKKVRLWLHGRRGAPRGRLL